MLRKLLKRLLQVLIAIGVNALVGVGCWIGFLVWHYPFEPPSGPLKPVRFEADAMVVPLPTEVLLADVARFDNELSAYLWFDYLRARRGIDASQVLLVVAENKAEAPTYKIQMVVPNDALTTVPFLADLEARGLIQRFNFEFSTQGPVEYSRKQTGIFMAAYKRPVANSLEDLSDKQLLPRTARFLAFKSRTDPRTRETMGPGFAALGEQEATDLAADIIAVSKFYAVPLDVFLGIGAMENNYLSIQGDLSNSIWKKKPAKDDIVLRRKRRRVLVSNYSIGVWQITRETLRHAHSLYLNDRRKHDYAVLPQRLVPPDTLELDLTNPHVLTTYAGLLLRDLLDRFNGDVEKAVGAYNGGPRNPNPQYAAGVQMVASYARNVLERVSAVNERATQAGLGGKEDASPNETETP